MRASSRLIVALASALLFLCGSAAVAADDLDQPVPLDSEVRVGKLPNGFTYYIRRYLRPRGKVEMRLVVNAGTQHEDSDQHGLAHLLEHVAFNGTAHYPGQALLEYFDKSGVRPGEDWNGHTIGHNTSYLLRLPTDKPQLIESGYQILRDWAQGLMLDPVEIDNERGVVVAETTDKGNFQNELWNDVYVRFLHHPEHRADRRSRENANVKTAPASALVRFYRDWYRPDLQAAIVVGDIDIDEVEGKIKAMFSDLVMPEHPRAPGDSAARHSVPLTGKNAYVKLPHDEVKTIAMRMFMKAKSKYPGTSKARFTVGDYRDELLDQLYDEMIRVRFAEFGARNGTVSPLHGSIARHDLSPAANIDTIGAQVVFKRVEDIEPGFKSVLIALEQVKRYGFLRSEFALARDEVRRSLEMRPEQSTEDLAWKYEAHFARGYAAPAPDFESRLKSRLLDEIVLDDVNRHVRGWIGTERNFDVGILAPTKVFSLLPSEDEVWKWAREVREGLVEAFAEPPAPNEHLMRPEQVAALPPGAVVKTVAIDEIAATELSLGNGIKLVLKPHKGAASADGRIEIAGFTAGGFMSLPQSERPSAQAAAWFFENSAVQGHDRPALESFLRGNEIRLGASMEGNTTQVYAGSASDQLESMLQLLYLRLTARGGNRDTLSKEFEAWLRSSKELSGTEQFPLVMDAARYADGHPGVVPDRRELEQVDFARAYEIYRNRIMQPGRFTFVVTGDFEPGVIQPLLIRYLGALPSSNANANQCVCDSAPMRMGSLQRTVHGGDPDRANVSLYFSGRFQDTLLNRTKLQILGHALHQRILQRLREKESAAYGPKADIRTADEVYCDTNSYAFSVTFICAASDVERLITAAREEVARLRVEGLDPALYGGAMQNARTGGLLGGYTWLSYIREQTLRGGDMTEILKRPGILSDIITPEIMNAAAHQYLIDDNFMRFVRLPAKAQVAGPVAKGKQ